MSSQILALNIRPCNHIHDIHTAAIYHHHLFFFFLPSLSLIVVTNTFIFISIALTSLSTQSIVSDIFSTID